MPPLRVVNVIEDARVGGPQRRIVAVAGLLRAEGIETIVYTADRDCEAFTSELERKDMRFRTFPLVRLQSGIGKQLRYALDVFPQVWRYYRAFKADRPDLIHANSASQWRPVIAARLAGVPCVWHLNDTYMPAAVRLVFRMAQRTAAGFIVSGRRVERYYLPEGARGRTLERIHAPVDTKIFFADNGKRAADVAALPGIKVVNVGNFNPDKDIETLIRVAAEVGRRAVRPVSFVQVGGLFGSQDAYTSRMRQLAADLGAGITFLGHRSDVADILRASDIYLHTARNESSGMAVWEALACGLPVATTDVADYRELNSEAEFALLAPVGGVSELTQHVLSLLDPGARDRLKRGGRGIVENHVDVGHIAAAHSRVYRTVIGRDAIASQAGSG